MTCPSCGSTRVEPAEEALLAEPDEELPEGDFMVCGECNHEFVAA